MITKINESIAFSFKFYSSIDFNCIYCFMLIANPKSVMSIQKYKSFRSLDAPAIDIVFEYMYKNINHFVRLKRPPLFLSYFTPTVLHVSKSI